MMEPIVLDPVHIEGRISGASVIDDLCSRIGDRLARNCDLRPTDSYDSYSAKVTIELSLVDVDTAKVTETITVGQMPQPPKPISAQPQAITLDIKPVVASMVIDRREPAPSETLERAVDGSIPISVPFVQPNLERNYDGSDPHPPEPVPAAKTQPPKWATTPHSRAARLTDDVADDQ